ncbi:MAG: hypothetical protein ABI216_15975, partial [Devosia sp.]
VDGRPTISRNLSDATKSGSRWTAVIVFNGRRATIGLHQTRAEALAAADAALRKLEAKRTSGQH